MSTKTSTAALDLFRLGTLRIPGRVPSHPAGARNNVRRRSNAWLDSVASQRVRGSERSLRREEPLFDVRSKRTLEQAQVAVRQEAAMNSTNRKNTRSMRTILPVILRITLSLILWTLGASMTLLAAEPKEYRVVYNFPVDRTKIESLQRWVNSGHDDWCRDPQLVAVASLQRILPESGNFELTSAPVEAEPRGKTTAVYTIHSLDGSTTYRVTLRRCRWLLPLARSTHNVIWVPVQAEIIERANPDAAAIQPGFVAAAF
jgi:hypothetical protein